ncbi:MAG: zinc ribbon domain-containing protein [Euryarchaeota archaeon]
MGKSYICSKCDNTTYVKDKIRATGSGLTRFFDIQNKKFNVVSCKRCGYSELYRDLPGSTAGNILDFMIG